MQGDSGFQDLLASDAEIAVNLAEIAVEDLIARVATTFMASVLSG